MSKSRAVSRGQRSLFEQTHHRTAEGAQNKRQHDGQAMLKEVLNWNRIFSYLLTQIELDKQPRQPIFTPTE
jgi:hypothetical protein